MCGEGGGFVGGGVWVVGRGDGVELWELEGGRCEKGSTMRCHFWIWRRGSVLPVMMRRLFISFCMNVSLNERHIELKE